MLKEILDLVLSAFPGWALLVLELWDRLKRIKKHKRSDGKREEG